MARRPRVVALVGPTGTGKTELAAELARRSGAEVIGADSMQVYRGLDIGTAKPSRELRGEIPHHLIDIVDPDDPMSAGRYAELARRAAWQIHERGRPIVLCGGTGLYARAFAGGLVPSVAADPGLRRELALRDTEDLYAELAVVDPRAAKRIEPRDRVRIARALEIQRLGGRAQSEQHAAHRFGDRPFEMVWLGLDLEQDRLWPRIEARVAAMFEAGWVDEVRALYARGYCAELRSMQAIGYREVGWLLSGRMDEASAREAITTATRRYAKRQRTWFRSEPGLRWLDAGDPASVLRTALAALQGS